MSIVLERPKLAYASPGSQTAVPTEPIIHQSAGSLIIIAPPVPLWRMLIGPALLTCIATAAFLGGIMFLLFNFNRSLWYGFLPLDALVFALGVLAWNCTGRLIQLARHGRAAVRIEITPDTLVIDAPANGHHSARVLARHIDSLAL